MYNDEDGEMLDAPKYDMLSVKFRGDNHTIVLPYCEVANGDILQIGENTIEIVMIKDEELEKVKMHFKNFVEVVETTFDIKEVVELSVQLAGSYDQITIL